MKTWNCIAMKYWNGSRKGRQGASPQRRKAEQGQQER